MAKDAASILEAYLSLDKEVNFMLSDNSVTSVLRKPMVCKAHTNCMSRVTPCHSGPSSITHLTSTMPGAVMACGDLQVPQPNIAGVGGKEMGLACGQPIEHRPTGALSVNPDGVRQHCGVCGESVVTRPAAVTPHDLSVAQSPIDHPTLFLSPDRTASQPVDRSEVLWPVKLPVRRHFSRLQFHGKAALDARLASCDLQQQHQQVASPSTSSGLEPHSSHTASEFSSRTHSQLHVSENLVATPPVRSLSLGVQQNCSVNQRPSTTVWSAVETEGSETRNLCKRDSISSAPSGSHYAVNHTSVTSTGKPKTKKSAVTWRRLRSILSMTKRVWTNTGSTVEQKGMEDKMKTKKKKKKGKDKGREVEAQHLPRIHRVSSSEPINLGEVPAVEPVCDNSRMRVATSVDARQPIGSRFAGLFLRKHRNGYAEQVQLEDSANLLDATVKIIPTVCCAFDGSGDEVISHAEHSSSALTVKASPKLSLKANKLPEDDPPFRPLYLMGVGGADLLPLSKTPGAPTGVHRFPAPPSAPACLSLIGSGPSWSRRTLPSEDSSQLTWPTSLPPPVLPGSSAEKCTDEVSRVYQKLIQSTEGGHLNRSTNKIWRSVVDLDGEQGAATGEQREDNPVGLAHLSSQHSHVDFPSGSKGRGVVSNLP